MTATPVYDFLYELDADNVVQVVHSTLSCTLGNHNHQNFTVMGKQQVFMNTTSAETFGDGNRNHAGPAQWPSCAYMG